MEESKLQQGVQKNIQELFEKQSVNKPKTGSWKGTEVKRDDKGNILPVHSSQAPNRWERRLEKQPKTKRNRKNTAGRKTQTAPVMQVVDKTQYGNIVVPTGYQRKIIHNSAAVNARKNSNEVKIKAYEGRNPLPPAAETDDNKG